jgi:hypothetical protein
MAARLLVLLVATALLVPACTEGPTGPSGPLPTDVDVDDAVRASGARAAARAFVDAYARSPSDGGEALRPLVGTPLLRRWAAWLPVQNDGFPGVVSSATSAILIGPAAPFEVESVPGSAEILRQVDVRASVAFSFEPDDGEPFTVARSLDGPMRLIRTSGGDWSVVDFTRDAIPLSGQFEAVADAGAASAAADVAIAVFFAAPIWQFGLVVRASAPLQLSRDRITLVDAGGATIATAGAVTTQLERIPSGSTVRGLVTFEPRSSADGLSLRLVLEGGDGRTALEIPLADRIHPIEVQGSSPSPGPQSSSA